MDEEFFVHMKRDPLKCVEGKEHDFTGWREFEDGRGGEQVCANCGVGAMEHSLALPDEPKLATPHLPRTHPQNTPLSKWRDAWLTLSVCQHTSTLYLVATDDERRQRGWPVTRQEKIDLLVSKGDIPSAGIGDSRNEEQPA